MKKVTILLVLLIGILFAVLTYYEFLSSISSKNESITRGWYTTQQYKEHLAMMQEQTFFIIIILFLISGIVLLFIKSRRSLKRNDKVAITLILIGIFFIIGIFFNIPHYLACNSAYYHPICEGGDVDPHKLELTLFGISISLSGAILFIITSLRNTTFRN